MKKIMMPYDADNNNVVESSTEIEDLLHQLSLMCQQEDQFYGKSDYIRTAKQRQQQQQQQQRQHQASSLLSQLSHPKVVDVDEIKRSLMVTWCYDVATFSNLNASVVEIAMNIVDRFMATTIGNDVIYDCNVYQLICMTALYTTAKVHETTCIDLKLLQRLSGDLYTDEQFVAIESIMLQALQWRVCPPTTSMYIDLMIQMIPGSILSFEERPRIYKLAIKEAERLMREPSLYTIKSYSIRGYG
jgi:Cyclin, N-terminal domain